MAGGSSASGVTVACSRINFKITEAPDRGRVRACDTQHSSDPIIVPHGERGQLHVGLGPLGNHCPSVWDRWVCGGVCPNNECWVDDVSAWAADRPAKIADVVVVEVAQFHKRVNALSVDDVVVGSTGETDAKTHCAKLISSHLGCL